MADLLVIGASRGIGLATVKAALERGQTVRAFARTASAIDINHSLLEKTDGDALDPKQISLAVRDCSCVVQTLGVRFNLRLLTGPITLFSQSTRLLIDAMQNAGVERLLAVTGYAAGDSRDTIHWLQKPAFQLAFGRAYADKSTQEALIKQSTLNWTIARPGMLTNGRKSADYQVLSEPEDWVNGAVSRASVADFLVEQSTRSDFTGKTPVLVQQRWF